MPSTEDPTLDFADIQGFIIRGYTHPYARHFMLRIDDAASAKTLIGSLVSGNQDTPQITTAAPWLKRPLYLLNIGFTYPGIASLKLPPTTFDTNDNYLSFYQGAVGRAPIVFDTGASAPENWIAPFNTASASELHIILSLYTDTSDYREKMSEVLRALFAPAVTELSFCDGFDFPGGMIHFGYKDGISQPTIKGGPPRPPDAQAPVEAYNVILQDVPAAPYNMPTPAQLGRNGSFGAFRILEQDVAGFEDFLQQQSTAIDPELLAAKMCGRWRNGTPLTLSPDNPTPTPPIQPDQLDNYDYVPSQYSPDAYNDKYGVRCPIGSHMRRTNPRSEVVAGGPVSSHRIVRRAVSYGPPYDPQNPHDGIPRGLIGYFICAVLANQFEFLMSTWVNTGTFTTFLPQASKDPLLGSNDPTDSILDIPYLDQNNKPQHRYIQNFERFITTRAGAYCFLPGIAALGYISTAPITDS